MKKSLNILFCSFFALLFSLNSFAQDDKKDNKSTTITYDFEKNEFDKTFPFDQNFKIKIIKVEAGIERIEVKIYNTSKVKKIQKELKNRNKTKIKNLEKALKKDMPKKDQQEKEKELEKNQITISKESLLSNPRILVLSNGTETIGSDRIAYIGFPHKLSPNDSYYFEIKGLKLTDLKEYQKLEIKKHLEQSKNISKLISEYIKTLILDDKDLDYKSFLNQYKPQLFIEVQKSLNELNSNFTIKQPNNSELETRLKNLNLASKITDLKDIIGDLKALGLNAVQKETFDSNLRNNLNLDSKPDEIKDVLFKDIELVTIQNGKISTGLNTALEKKNEIIEMLLNNILVKYIKEYSSINTTYELDKKLNAKKYVSTEIGYGYAFNTTHFSHANMNIYLRPRNDYIPFKQYPFLEGILAKTYFLVGITLTGDISNDNRKGIIDDNQSVIVGFGCDIRPTVKLNLGSLFYYNQPNSLISQNELKLSPFISLGLDLSKILTKN